MDKVQDPVAQHWRWNPKDRSSQCLVSGDGLEVLFHPKCSRSSAAIRGTTPLTINGNSYFWEVEVFDRIFGTSVMLGVCTKKQRLHMDSYYNLVGLDREGWSLSHKGQIWHKGEARDYSDEFPEDRPVTIGLLLDTGRGELSYFMDGKPLGVAFEGLTGRGGELYPVVGSTSKKTRMRLVKSICEIKPNLAAISSSVLSWNCRNLDELIQYMQSTRVPIGIINSLSGSSTRFGQTNRKQTAKVDHKLNRFICKLAAQRRFKSRSRAVSDSIYHRAIRRLLLRFESEYKMQL